MSIVKFIENNRQTGSTRALACAALASDGYLVVVDRDTKNLLSENFPGLRILTMGQVSQGEFQGDKRPVFFDAPTLLSFK